MTAPVQESRFVRFVRALYRAHLRRERLQAGLDAVRWTSCAYALSLVGLAVVAGPVAHGARGVLAALAAAAALALFWRLIRRRRRRPEELLAALEQTAGVPQLLLTAWEWSQRRLSSPLGPAILHRADQVVVESGSVIGTFPARSTPIAAIVRPPVGLRRTLAAVAAAVLLSLPGPLATLDRLGGELRRLALAPAAPRQEQPAPFSPEEARLLQRLAELLQRQADATGDLEARRAASELQRLLSTPGPSGSGPAVPSDGRALATPYSGDGQPPPRLASSGGLAPGTGLSGLEQRLALLMRLAALGLISPETADRSAELAALMSLDAPAAPAPTQDGEAPRDASAPDAAPQDPGSPGVPAPGAPGEPSPAPRDEAAPSRGGDEQERPPTPATAAARPGAPGPQRGERGEPAATEALSSIRGGDAWAQADGPATPARPQGPAEDAALPGTEPGTLESAQAAGSDDLASPHRVVVPSFPLLRPGPAHVVSGVPAPPRPEPPEPAWSPPEALSWYPGDAGPAPDVESVPLEYREAVRRYFEAMAREGR